MRQQFDGELINLFGGNYRFFVHRPGIPLHVDTLTDNFTAFDTRTRYYGLFHSEDATENPFNRVKNKHPTYGLNVWSMIFFRNTK